jgi:hypothetical protein
MEFSPPPENFGVDLAGAAAEMVWGPLLPGLTLGKLLIFSSYWLTWENSTIFCQKIILSQVLGIIPPFWPDSG